MKKFLPLIGILIFVLTIAFAAIVPLVPVSAAADVPTETESTSDSTPKTYTEDELKAILAEELNKIQFNNETLQGIWSQYAVPAIVAILIALIGYLGLTPFLIRTINKRKKAELIAGVSASENNELKEKVKSLEADNSLLSNGTINGLISGEMQTAINGAVANLTDKVMASVGLDKQIIAETLTTVEALSDNVNKLIDAAKMTWGGTVEGVNSILSEKSDAKAIVRANLTIEYLTKKLQEISGEQAAALIAAAKAEAEKAVS